ncbi:flagellar hook-basal body complex protein [Halarcobacter sp.]|uniref:flagellar hook-basal body complex protein n=1 Tax=Halarcobacter sp. TaxID=2321133 RepID=UPI003A9354BB
MISGLWNGISGLDTFEKALSSQSNNVTNSNTIGHKSDRISFADMMYQSGYGKGVAVQSIQKDFSQGGLKITNNDLDIAIEGKGFFIVNDPLTGEEFYTRAGNFKMGANGTLQTVDNKTVYGSSTVLSNIVSSDGTTQFNNNYNISITSKQISATDYVESINAKATDFTQTAQDSGVSGSGFKDRSSKISDIREMITNYNEKLDLFVSNPNAASTAPVSQQTQISFNAFLADLQNDGDFVEVNIDGEKVRQYFDTDTQTTMNLFADKLSSVTGLTASVDGTGLVTIDSLIPGRSFNIKEAAINDSAPAITETVSPVTGSGRAMVDSARNALKTALEAADAKLLEMTHTIGNSNAALTGIGELQLRLDNLNISENVFGNLSVEDGVIYAKDGDNKFLVGKLETAYFTNPGGLSPQGNNLYAATDETGDRLNASNVNNLVGGAIELSNTDLGDGLVDMMVYQRAFEASSKSITTSDEFLKTAIQLKR